MMAKSDSRQMAQQQALQAQALKDKARQDAVQQARDAAAKLNPELVKLEYLKELNKAEASDALTWLTDDEITDFSILEAVHRQLQTPSGVGGMPAAIYLLQRFKSMRRSKEGLVLQSIVSILRQASHYIPLLPPGPMDSRPGILSRILGGNKQQEQGGR